MFCPYAPASELKDKKFDEKSKLYKETKDKKYLIREPSFTDPDFQEKAKKIVQETTKQAMLYGGAHDYVISDEFGLGKRYSYYDFDFLPSSIQAFREWLKKQYKTISALNKEWETDYKTWEEIEPLTLEEARKIEMGTMHHGQTFGHLWILQ